MKPFQGEQEEGKLDFDTEDLGSVSQLLSIATDIQNDGRIANELGEAAMLAQLQGLAEETVLGSHPVTPYVLRCPVESFDLHPANKEYDGFCSPCETGTLGSLLRKNDAYIEWSMPGHDESLAKANGCGYVRQNLVQADYVACVRDFEHYAKFKKKYCWMLGCPNCMNDTALRRGAVAEKKLVAYADIQYRKGLGTPQLKHWVVSPPQWPSEAGGRIINQMMTVKGYQDLCKHVTDSLKAVGCLGGLVVFHPWRNQRIDTPEGGAGDNDGAQHGEVEDKYWKCSPHFHVLCYGFLDTAKFRSDNPGWILAQIHPGEEIRSVRQTLGYLLTHAGIGKAEQSFTVRSHLGQGKNRKLKPELQYNQLFFDVENTIDGPVCHSEVNGARRCIATDPERAEHARSLARSIGEGEFLFMSEVYNPEDKAPCHVADYRHEAENDALNQAVMDLLIPERDFNIADYTYSGKGATYELTSNPENRVRLYAEHLDAVDWVDWTMSFYSRTFMTIRPMGELSARSMSVFETYKDHAPRTCSVCGSDMCEFHGVNDPAPEKVLYTRNLRIFGMAEDLPRVRTLWEKYEEPLRDEGKTVMDFSLMLPQLSSSISSGIDDYIGTEKTISCLKSRKSSIVWVPQSMDGPYVTSHPIIVDREDENLCLALTYLERQFMLASHPGSRTGYIDTDGTKRAFYKELIKSN